MGGGARSGPGREAAPGSCSLEGSADRGRDDGCEPPHRRGELHAPRRKTAALAAACGHVLARSPVLDGGRCIGGGGRVQCPCEITAWSKQTSVRDGENGSRTSCARAIEAGATAGAAGGPSAREAEGEEVDIPRRGAVYGRYGRLRLRCQIGQDAILEAASTITSCAGSGRARTAKRRCEACRYARQRSGPGDSVSSA